MTQSQNNAAWTRVKVLTDRSRDMRATAWLVVTAAVICCAAPALGDPESVTQFEPQQVQQGQAPGLPFFMRAALTHAHRLKAARATRSEAAAASTVALGELLPRLTASAGYVRNQFEARGLSVDPDTGATTPVIVLPREQWHVDGRVSLALIDGGRWYRYAAARSARLAAHAALHATRSDVLMQVATHYFAALTAQQKRLSSERALAAAEADLKYVHARRRIGDATALTVARAQLEVQRARQRLTDNQRLLLRSLRQLATLCGTAQPQAISPVGVELRAPSPDGLKLAAIRPELAAAKAEHQRASATAGEARWHLFPAVQLVGTEHYGNTPGFSGRRGWYSIGLLLQLDLDLGRIARVAQTSAQVAVAAARTAEIEDALADELYEARLDVTAGIETVETAREAERVAVQAAEAARAQFRLGLATQRDVIEGERDRVAAEAERAEAEASLALAWMRLRRARSEDLLPAPAHATEGAPRHDG